MRFKYRILINPKSIDDPAIGIAFKRYDGQDDDGKFTSFLYGRMEVMHRFDKAIEDLVPEDAIEKYGFNENAFWDQLKEIDLPETGKNIYDVFSDEIEALEIQNHHKTA
jgi:hypothetical protein